MAYWGVDSDGDDSDGDGGGPMHVDNGDDDTTTSFLESAAAVTGRMSTEQLIAELAERKLPLGASPAQVSGILDALRQRWVDRKPDLSLQSYYSWAAERAGLETASEDEHSPLVVERAFIKWWIVLYELTKLAELTKDEGGSESMLSLRTESGLARREALARLFGAVEHSKRFMLEHAAMTAHFCNESFASLSLEERLASPMTMTADNMAPHQRVESYVLNKLAALGYRLHKDQCYRRVLNADGVHTFAWEPVCSVAKFIAQEVTMEKCFSIYLDYTANGSYRLNEHLADFLCNKSDQSRFKLLVPDRTLFAFKNGLWSAKYCAFFAFSSEDEWEEVIAAARLRFSSYDDSAENFRTPNRDDDSTLCYFDVDFPCEDEINSFADIMSVNLDAFPTPSLDSILTYQRLTPETILNVYALLGRVFFDTGDYDDFQVAVVFKGVAQSGKSSITTLIADCFDPARVAALAGNMQREFGWEETADCDLVTILELSRQTNMDQKVLQSAISGERVPITRKHKTTLTLPRFKASFLMARARAGNELPEWRDASNSMTRRIVLIPFNRIVVTQNENLKHELRRELGWILPKLHIAYRQLCIRSQNRGFWGKLPNGEYIASQQLRDVKAELMSELQPLVAHILRSQRYLLCWSDDTLDREETYMPESVFIEAFRQWCKEIGIAFPVWIADTYGTTFESYQIEKRVATVAWQGESIRENILYGITLAV